MAVTTIPWGDGSGDNLYLTYPSASGDQTIEVSSDANTGSDDRTINITLTASHHGTSSAKILTITQEGVPEAYIVFVDPTVEQICATNWGDGTGIKPSQAAQVTNSQLGTTFRNNTQITSFDELQYFTGLTQIPANAFNGCSSLLDITIPNTVTTIDNSALGTCSALQSLTVLSTSALSIRFVGNSGDGTGTVSFFGDVTSYDGIYNYKKLIVHGNFSYANYQSFRGEISIIKIGGNLTSTVTLATQYRGIKRSGTSIEFFEVGGIITSTQAASVIAYNANMLAGGLLVHLGYDAVANNALPCLPVHVSADNTNVAKIYVGDGSSAAHDNAILAQYTNDSGWSSYSSKLDTWYNYINDPNANPDYIN